MNVVVQQQNQLSQVSSSQEALSLFIEDTLPMNILQEMSQALNESYVSKAELEQNTRLLVQQILEKT
jgi:hypothetical protein